MTPRHRKNDLATQTYYYILGSLIRIEPKTSGIATMLIESTFVFDKRL